MIKGNEIGFMDNNVFVKVRFGLGKGMMKFGNDLLIEKDGYLGELKEGRVVLDIKVYDSNIHGFTIQPGQKRIVVPKKDIEEDPDNPCKNYTLNIAVKDNYEGGFYTQYPSNSLGLLLVKDGIVEYWRVSVVDQNNKFFLINEKVYESALYLDSDNNLHCFHQKLEQWGSMMDFTRLIVNVDDALLKLLDVSKNTTGAVLFDTHGNYSDNRGVVAWFSIAEGTGAILMNKGIAKFHWATIITEDRFVSLEKGAIVEYDELHAPTDARSNFKYEASGIKAL